MNIKLIPFAALLLMPTAYAADQQSTNGMPMNHKGMDAPANQETARNTVTASGTVKKVIPEKGLVTIAHGPVEALGWPSMTMSFRATPDQLQTLEKGDQVAFDFYSEGMDSVITRMEKQ